MPPSTSASEEVRIAVDLRLTRAESERLGIVDKHKLFTGDLCGEIRSVLAANPDVTKSSVRPVPMSGAVASKDAFQIIDWIMIGLAPIGLAGIVKLIVQLVEACRTKIPTSIEVEIGGTKIKVSGPKVRPEDVLELRAALESLQAADPVKLYSADGEVIRIRTLPGPDSAK